MTHSDISPIVLLTGPTSGIGERILAALLSHPRCPDLILMARSPPGLKAALEKAAAHGIAAHGVHVDLGDLASIRGALDELGAAQRRGDLGLIDVAMLNAGAQFADRRKHGAEGYELTFTVNVIAQHLLVRGLEPSMASGAHTVVMGSSTHRGKKASFNLVPDPQWQDPAEMARPDPSSESLRPADKRERGGVAYASSKLALVTASHDWAERSAAAGRRLNTYDPGLVPGTGLGKDLPGYMYWVWKNVMPAMRVLPGATTAPTTARHAVELAMGETYPSLNDGYVEIGHLSKADPVTFDTERRRALRAWLDMTVDGFMPAQSDGAASER